ncbi:S24 family peptidase [Lichenicoccus roseus]|uniref:Helix-turn-helix transcriptional regulator n=1 Tax=Lichenicoccus roseus TaxID=2683649 RepID=A0A5R9JF72_9PROT|nr:helix-turn-helix transcriptional regulator [Lichenicoccus roseus]TLU74291.1 helix-turn-helix transcriptional regulator [Lichenicoccus roseus]
MPEGATRVGLTHEDVWRALDTLAAEKGLSPSGLARAAGLDPTAFNRSKRATPHGRLRWPSTESLSRVLAATGATLENFTALVGGARALSSGRPPRGARRLRLLAYSRLGHEASVPDQGDETTIPVQTDPGSYAVRLDTDTYEPVLREGSLLVVSPDQPIGPGDRVLLRLRTIAGDDEPVGRAPAIAGLLEKSNQHRLELSTLDPAARRLVLETEQVAWMHRIGWVSF